MGNAQLQNIWCLIVLLQKHGCLSELYPYQIHHLSLAVFLACMWSRMSQLVEHCACNTRNVGSIPGANHT